MGRRRDAATEKPPRPPLPAGFGAIWVTVAIDLVGFGIVLPILPQYAEDLKIGPAMIGLIVGSFSLAQMVFSPILGRLSDRYGRKPVLLYSLVGTSIGSLLTGLAGPVWLLFLGRVIDGSSGASVSVAQAAVADVAEPGDRARLMGLLGAAFGVGFVLGPAIGSVAALGGKHLPFFIAAAIAGANALVAVRRLPETHPDKVHLVHGEPAEVGDPGARHTPADAEPVRPTRSLDLGVLRAVPPTAVRLITVAFVSLFAFSGFEATFSLLVKDRLDYTLASTGAVFTVIGLGLVLVQGGLIHPAQARLGELGVLRFGLVCNAVGLVLLAVDARWLALAPALVLLVLGQGLVTPTMSSAVAGQVDARDRGRLLGFQQSSGAFARFVGPVVAGLLYEHVGIPAPYLLGAALVALALTLVPAAREPAGLSQGRAGA